MSTDPEITDPGLVEVLARLVKIAQLEVTLRSALLAQGAGARRHMDRAVRSSLHALANDTNPEIEGVIHHLRVSQRGVSRRRNVMSALKWLVAERRALRYRVDQQAALLGIEVPPLQLGPPLTPEQHSDLMRRTDALLEEHGSLEALDASLENGSS